MDNKGNAVAPIFLNVLNSHKMKLLLLLLMPAMALGQETPPKHQAILPLIGGGYAAKSGFYAEGGIKTNARKHPIGAQVTFGTQVLHATKGGAMVRTTHLDISPMLAATTIKSKDMNFHIAAGLNMATLMSSRQNSNVDQKNTFIYPKAEFGVGFKGAIIKSGFIFIKDQSPQFRLGVAIYPTSMRKS